MNIAELSPLLPHISYSPQRRSPIVPPDMCQLFYSHGHGFFSYTDIERKLKKEKWRLIFWNVKMIQGLPLTEFRMN